MEIRQLRSDEFDTSLNLSEYAFQYKLSPKDREKAKERFKPERVWGIFDDNGLGAKFTLLPFQSYIQGRPLLMGGIAGVATWPENRRQGLVAKLLAHALMKMNEAGQTLSCLHPFYVPFYRKFGWEVYCEYKKYTIPAAKFPAKVQVEGRVKRDEGDIDILDALYRKFASNYNGTLVRDKDWWEKSVLDDDGHIAVFYSQEGEPEGYALYKIQNRELIIDEFVYANGRARSGLWNYFANHDSMITQAHLKMVPADDNLPFLLPDPRITQENHPYFMARIVNVKEFVEQLSFCATGRSGEITLSIADSLASWNDGLWNLSADGYGKPSIQALQSDPGEETAACGIGTLTAMLLGYKRPMEMYQAGLLTGNILAVTWLEERIPHAQTALFDFF
ncbi:GNAT family N-acetyltransferase [Paenibacillus rhizophilus]|uniref:GNAT family N-acetyltransferase n=1 Tax=Paenibacillus rhizophilus TaxID=1850366 RepID=A0A3N9NXG6_9BACL|nr:GNAT family N-acetyltransferase [Paenibacillus rhizophilus]RQW07997.1 GNAT family N-acetyltransferase [Paenibacillus rhizophilus]